MPAAKDFFVDPSLASNTGSGTLVDPYGDLQHALNSIPSGPGRGADGDRINIKAGTAEVLTAALSLATFGTPSNTQQLHFRGYTSAQGDGGIGEISGAGAFSMITDNTSSVHWTDMKIGNSGAEEVIRCGGNCSFLRTELHTSSNQYLFYINGGSVFVINCWAHGFTGAAGAVIIAANGAVLFLGNFIDAGSIDTNHGALYLGAASTGSVALNNVIKCNHAGAQGLKMQGGANAAIGNSIFNGAAGTEEGIDLENTSGIYLCYDNIIEGWSGTGGRPIRSGGTAIAPYLSANNLFFNNATNSPNYNDDPIRQEGEEILTASAFAAPGSNDFRVSIEAKEKALLKFFLGAPSTVNKQDAGAAQRLESAGGGGTRKYGCA